MLKFKKGDWVKEVAPPHRVGVVTTVNPRHGYYPYSVTQAGGQYFWIQEEMISASDVSASVSEEKCWNCKLYAPAVAGAGRCRRFPPAFAGRDTASRFDFPIVESDSWCGEWKAPA